MNDSEDELPSILAALHALFGLPLNEPVLVGTTRPSSSVVLISNLYCSAKKMKETWEKALALRFLTMSIKCSKYNMQH